MGTNKVFEAIMYNKAYFIKPKAFMFTKLNRHLNKCFFNPADSCVAVL